MVAEFLSPEYNLLPNINLDLDLSTIQIRCMDSQRMSEYTEPSTITFEWILRDLRNIFDSTTGDKKSDVIKSALFGDNRWQV